MLKSGTIALVLFAFAQLASVAGFALVSQSQKTVSIAGLSDNPLSLLDVGIDPLGQIDLMTVLLEPGHWIVWGLLFCAMAGLCVYVARRLQDSLRARRARLADAGRQDGPDLAPTAAGPLTARSMARLYDGDQTFGEYAPLLIGLAASAVWPWLMERWPLVAQALALVAVIGVLSAVMRGRRSAGQITQSWSLGFFAGWVWLSGCAALARFLQDQTGASATTCTILSILVCAGGTFAIQLHLGRNTGFSVAVIWGLIAIAAATIFVNAVFATVAVLCIAYIALGLVRATT